MLKFDVGKREHNKATQKMDILNAFLREMEKKKLHQINVEDVCLTLGISKVTFFNYYSNKEALVEYFIQLWNYQMGYEISEQNKKGKAVLYHYFDRVSQHPSVYAIMSALTAFFTKVECYEPTQVSDYELYLYNEEAYKKGYRHQKTFDLFNNAVMDMKLSQQKHQILLANIMSGFYGIPFVTGLGFGNDLKQMYRNYLEALLPEEA